MPTVVISLIVGMAIGAGVAIAALRSRSVAVEPMALGERRAGSADAASGDIGSVLRRAADQFSRGVVICDATGEVVYRNTAASAMTGTHAGIIVDTHLDEMLAVARSGRSSEKRIDLHGPPRMSIEVVARAMDDGYGVATIDDVSERTRIDAMRTDFVANISHELKTPVGAIAVLAETLEDEIDPEVAKRVSGRIVDESHRAVTTIDDLLELSRIESTRLSEEVVDLCDIVNVAIARGRDVDGGAEVSVALLDAPCPILIHGDRPQLSSAIGNLVENAVKYSDDGGAVQLRISIDDEYVEVIVVDQGPGIPQRDLDRIFERFYRVDRARSRTTGGTGLGLSIVRHVATNHGGDVQVTSHEGDGATFVFRLPVSLLVAGFDDDEETTT